jgi:ABC-2 type transport system ATP-binding protein
VLQGGTIETALPAAVAIVGVNGSGKTSLFLHLCDALLRRKRQAELQVGSGQVRIAFAPQAPALPDWLTPAGAAALYGLDFDQVHAELPGLHLDEIAGKRFGSMSVGQQQALGVALAVGRDANLLILDEPFSALDFRRRIALIDALAAWKARPGDRALLLSSQNASDLVELCEYFVVLRDGRYVFNAPRDELVGGAIDARTAERKLLRLLT